MEQDSRDMALRKNVEKTFIQREDVDIHQPHVLAAVITAASQMSRVTDIATPEMTTEQLLDVYGALEDGQVTSLIGMSSSYIKLNTGYSVQVEDASAAQANYDSNKDTYDAIYTDISERAKAHEMASGKTM